MHICNSNASTFGWWTQQMIISYMIFIIGAHRADEAFTSIGEMCLAGAVANVADSDRCCNPKMPSSIPAAGKDFP